MGTACLPHFLSPSLTLTHSLPTHPTLPLPSLAHQLSLSPQNDPWMTQSINVTLSPTLPAIIIDHGAHHSDLGGPYNPVPSSEDTPSLVAARQFEIDTVNTWIKEIQAERVAAKARLQQATGILFT
jgi:hypothetical protein